MPRNDDGMATIFVRHLPHDLRKAFKIACLRDGVTMNERILEYIRREVEIARYRDERDDR